MRTLAALAAICLLTGCDTPVGPKTGSGRSAPAVPTTQATAPAGSTVTVDPSQVRQSIDGFGGSNAWTALPSDATAQAAVVKLLFSTTEGAGLTIIRNRIPFREDTGNSSHTGYADNFMAKDSGGNYTYTTSGGHKSFSLNWSNWDLADTRTLYTQASAYSPQIRGFSTAWTPPNNQYDHWKIDDPSSGHLEGSVVNTIGGTYGDITSFPSIGGVLDPGHYQDYADVLADYAKNFQANMGYPLAAVSIQNEPNFLPQTYESCWWTMDDFHTFLPYLKSSWKAKGAGTPVIAAESYSFIADLLSESLQDSATSGTVSIAAVHQYNASYPSSGAATVADSSFGAAWLTPLKQAGKRLWVTEVSKGSANDASINDGIYWARLIHNDLTVAEVNAFCYWWLWTNGSSATLGSLINVNGTTVTDNKRLYTLGQFSRFVRPGWVRLNAVTDPVSGVQTSVFKDPNSQSFAVVLINDAGASASVTVAATKTIASAELYRTSATESLADIQALAAGTKSLTVGLPALSVSTVYGTLAP